MKGTLKDLTVNRDGSQNVTVTVETDFAKTFDALKGKPVDVEIKKASTGRSRNANDFCWALCTAIGKAMTPPLDKLEVYRMAIKAVGVYVEKDLLTWDVPTVRQRWEGRGDGWLFEVVDDAPQIGYKKCFLHFGSSVYTTAEMQLLLEWLKDQCDQMGVVIPLSRQEEERLLERWEESWQKRNSTPC